MDPNGYQPPQGQPNGGSGYQPYEPPPQGETPPASYQPPVPYQPPYYQQPPYGYQQPPYQPPYYQPPYYQPPDPGPQESIGCSVASLILGILSVVCCCLWFGAISPIGLILGIVGLKKAPSSKGMAVAGIILSLLGLLGLIVMILSTVTPIVAVLLEEAPYYY